ncbi:MAG: thioredoxin [Saprospiraceae bacterium]|nr:thioredoxin [Saprospiraceae bacterium]
MGQLNFEREVIKQSYKKPVLVDFWAPWCGPCRTLGPVIESLAEKHADKWDLVKVNTEEEMELAQQYGIRSIPNVKLFHRGELIAEFSGAMPAPSIEKWLDQHLPDERKDQLAALLERLDRGTDPEAVAQLEDFVGENPEVQEARTALAKQLIFSDPERAEKLVEDIKPGNPHYEAVEDLRELSRLIRLEGNGHAAGDVLLQAKHALEQRDFEQAIQKVIEATTIDKNYRDDLPRKAAIALFRTLGEHHPLTREYRPKFNMALY